LREKLESNEYSDEADDYIILRFFIFIFKLLQTHPSLPSHRPSYLPLFLCNDDHTGPLLLPHCYYLNFGQYKLEKETFTFEQENAKKSSLGHQLKKVILSSNRNLKALRPQKGSSPKVETYDYRPARRYSMRKYVLI
jgi:hypothetical protein